MGISWLSAMDIWLLPGEANPAQALSTPDLTGTPCDRAGRWGCRRPRDDDQRIGIVGPLLTIRCPRPESVLDPLPEPRRVMLPSVGPQPAFVLIQMLGHDLAILDPQEQVADRELRAGVGQGAPRPEQLGEGRDQPGALRTPLAMDQDRVFRRIEHLDQGDELGTRH